MQTLLLNAKERSGAPESKVYTQGIKIVGQALLRVLKQEISSIAMCKASTVIVYAYPYIVIK